MEIATRVAILGAGSWGTALAHHLTREQRNVVLWGRSATTLLEISSLRRNSRYFPEREFSADIAVQPDLRSAVREARIVVLAVPSHAYREISRSIRGYLAPETLIVSAAKGIEEGSWKRLSVVLAEELGDTDRIGVLSGPTFAYEVMDGCPTAVTLVFPSIEVANNAANIFHVGNLRVYSSDDVIGVELGGVIKNVIALAAGIVDGLEMGANSRAALITRGLAEMQRFVTVLGGRADTVVGLSGLGDLLLTCTGDLSRNRRVGLLLGRGKTLEEALSEVGQVAEGVSAAHKVLAIGREKKLSLPIVEEVERVLSGAISVREAVKNLLSRNQKPEASMFSK